MTPILAVADGTLDWMNFTGQLSSDNNLPYYNILLHGDDGNDYFYVHLSNDTPGTDDGCGGPENAYAPGMKNGTRVHVGEIIGYVGDSGNAEDVGSHLHLSLCRWISRPLGPPLPWLSTLLREAPPRRPLLLVLSLMSFLKTEAGSSPLEYREYWGSVRLEPATTVTKLALYNKVPFEVRYPGIAQAAQDTAGKILTYQGKPISA